MENKTQSNDLYWRSLEQKEGEKSSMDFLHREFPEGASELSSPVSRRTFVQLMGASAGLAGMVACRMPKEKIVPYVKSPEHLVPGKPKYYATAMTLGTQSYGLLVESNNGRPTKIEGNPKHPSSLGATNSFAQASILSLYDPSRSKQPKKDQVEQTWETFASEWETLCAQAKKNQGAKIAILSQTYASPSLDHHRDVFLAAYPKASWVFFDGGEQSNESAALTHRSGGSLRTYLNLSKAQVVLSLESDFLGKDVDSVRHTKEFSKNRKIESTKDSMNRLYVVEQSYSLTGANADHRLPVPSSHIYDVLVTVAQQLNRLGASVASLPKAKANKTEYQQSWISECAADLWAHRGQSLITVGKHQPKEVHALAAAINMSLGNQNKTVFYYKTLGHESSVMDLHALSEKLQAGQIDTLVILGGNPVFEAPTRLNLASLISTIANTIHFSHQCNETTKVCHWHLPQSHELESWGDVTNVDGTRSLIQPLIQPLFQTKSRLEMWALLSSNQLRSGYDLLTAFANQHGPSQNFWRKSLIEGVYNTGILPPMTPEVAGFPKVEPMEGIVVRFEHSSATFDGRFAENTWLQEAPDPMTKVSWENPALISPTMAKDLGVKNGQWISLETDHGQIEIPVWIMPGHARNSITVHLGYGREVANQNTKGVGFNVFPLRSLTSMNLTQVKNIKALSKVTTIASTQNHGSMEGRPLVRENTLEEFRKHPEFAKEAVEHPPLKSLWKEHAYEDGYQWGMSIDLTSCTGCNACTVACQSENNIPVVGKEQVINGREMNWIRIDRYFNGPEEDPMVVHQPVACVHCENAPCEQVCPVNATVHDDEGLNTMVYNRCIGTRYCSNNCPYKVRRFNFFNYTKDTPELMKMANNPDVTIRFRGVMEKCTYCVQRIAGAKQTAKIEDRKVVDGEITTACQQVCPADAIVFGDLSDPNSRVSKRKKLEQDYEMLAELNIKPRTSYLAQLRNPNPKMPSAGGQA
ncbi:MAG: TAT-variant-translocated molybdopterin oxidoreductase [Bdellovibrionota bacterium]